MNDLKYEFLYNEQNELTSVHNAVKGDKYRLYPGEPLDYIFRAGDINAPHFSLKANNAFAGVGVVRESIEHYNAKMKIAFEKKYFDTIFNKWVYFDEVEAEKKQDIKRPDLSCYQNKILVACIEIHFTNKKTESDIEKLKELDCLIVEIDIKNENRCEHIALPKIFELNKREFKKIAQEINHFETEYSRLAKELHPAGTYKITKFTDWLSERKIREFKNLFRNPGSRKELRDEASINRDIKKVKNEIEKLDYRIGKQEQQIESFEADVRERRKSFEKIAVKSKVEWFRNSWMSYKPQNLIEEIKYWLC